MKVRRIAEVLSPSNIAKSAIVWFWYQRHGYRVSFIKIVKI